MPSTFSSDIVLNWVMSFASFFFGVIFFSATCQHDGIVPFLQATLESVHTLGSNSGHIMYTLYGIPFGPGAHLVSSILWERWYWAFDLLILVHIVR